MARTFVPSARQRLQHLGDPLNLVFDLDGTLIDSAPQIHAAANFVMGSKGLPPVSDVTIRGFIGNGVDVLVGRLMAHHVLDDSTLLRSELVDRFIKIYEEAFDLTTLYPGVSTALSGLALAGHRLAICTNKPESPARAVLRHFRLEQYFPIILGGDTLPQRKPDPEPLWAVLRQMAPGKALFVGDSEVDAETAQAAGIPLALFTGGYRKQPVEALGAKLIFDAHAALPGLIAHLMRRV
jgi:phosphoglycolate phosphatase